MRHPAPASFFSGPPAVPDPRQRVRRPLDSRLSAALPNQARSARGGSQGRSPRIPDRAGIAPRRHRHGADNGVPRAERDLVTPSRNTQHAPVSLPKERQPADSPRCQATTTDAPGLQGASSPLDPLRCCLSVRGLVSVIFALHCAAWSGGRDKWFLLKATSTGRPESPRSSVKGQRSPKQNTKYEHSN